MGNQSIYRRERCAVTSRESSTIHIIPFKALAENRFSNILMIDYFSYVQIACKSIYRKALRASKAKTPAVAVQMEEGRTGTPNTLAGLITAKFMSPVILIVTLWYRCQV